MHPCPVHARVHACSGYSCWNRLQPSSQPSSKMQFFYTLFSNVSICIWKTFTWNLKFTFFPFLSFLKRFFTAWSRVSLSCHSTHIRSEILHHCFKEVNWAVPWFLSFFFSSRNRIVTVTLWSVTDESHISITFKFIQMQRALPLMQQNRPSSFVRSNKDASIQMEDEKVQFLSQHQIECENQWHLSSAIHPDLHLRRNSHFCVWWLRAARTRGTRDLFSMSITPIVGSWCFFCRAPSPLKLLGIKPACIWRHTETYWALCWKCFCTVITIFDSSFCNGWHFVSICHRVLTESF